MWCVRAVTYAKYAPVALGLEKTNSVPLSAVARGWFYF